MLSQKKVRDHFLELCPQESSDSISIEFVDIGNINYVYKISNSGKVYYLKYGMEHERKKTVFTDHMPLRENRLQKEVDFIKEMGGSGEGSGLFFVGWALIYWRLVHFYLHAGLELALMHSLLHQAPCQSVLRPYLRCSFFMSL